MKKEIKRHINEYVSVLFENGIFDDLIIKFGRSYLEQVPNLAKTGKNG